MSLGERCVQWCLSRAAEEPLPSVEALAIWFERVERDGQDMSWLAAAIRNNGKRYDHCAAAQCAAARECLYDGEQMPHGYRAAAKELMRDAIDHGTWHDVAELRAGEWAARPGDLVIYDRSTPGDPSSAWKGHVDRVVSVVGDWRLETIGANEVEGRWRQEIESVDNPRMLGVVAYPVEPEDDKPRRTISEADAERVRVEVALTTEVQLLDYWEKYHR